MKMRMGVVGVGCRSLAVVVGRLNRGPPTEVSPQLSPQLPSIGAGGRTVLEGLLNFEGVLSLDVIRAWRRLFESTMLAHSLPPFGKAKYLWTTQVEARLLIPLQIRRYHHRI